MNDKLERQYVELAIQTVFYRYKEQLRQLNGTLDYQSGTDDELQLIRLMSDEICDRAIQLQHVTSTVMDSMNQEEAGV